MAINHDYNVSVTWTGGRDGRGEATSGYSGHTTPIAVPPEFQGVGGASNPEEMMTAAIASCYSITYGIVSSMRRLPVASLNVEATGTVEQDGPKFTYTKIVIRPNIVLTSEATDDQLKMAEDVAHKADGYCIITNAVRGSVAVSVEPTVSRR